MRYNKNIMVALCVATALTITSCGKAKSLIQKFNETDTDTEALAEKGFSEEEPVQEQQEFESDDLGTFFLHGKVHTMTETYESDGVKYKMTFTFDKEGKLVRFDDNNEDAGELRSKITRKNGRISQLGEMEFATNLEDKYEYGATGQCKRHSIADMHSYTTYDYTQYDDRGYPVKAKVEGKGSWLNEWSEASGTCTFTYSDFDSHGNWQRCTRKEKLHTKTSTDDITDNGDIETTTTDKDVSKRTIIDRRITYYT